MSQPKFFQTSKGKLAYDDEGVGQLIVCIPGMGDIRQEYRFLKPILVKAGYRVITLDPRGQGESDVIWPDYSITSSSKDLVELINELNSGPAILVGNSIAAATSVYTASQNRNIVKGLVLIGPFVRDIKPVNLMLEVMYSVLFADFWGVNMWGMYWSSLFPVRKPNDFEEYKSRVLNNLKESGRLKVLRKLLLESKLESEKVLSQIKQPSLVIMGTKDSDFNDPTAEANLIAGKLNSKVVLIQDGGHYPQSDTPELTSSEIIKFLNEINKDAKK